MGHSLEECGDGVHGPDGIEYGHWMIAKRRAILSYQYSQASHSNPPRNRGRGRRSAGDARETPTARKRSSHEADLSDNEILEDTAESPMKTTPDGQYDGEEIQEGVEAQSLMVVPSAKKKLDMSTTSYANDGAGMVVAITSEKDELTLMKVTLWALWYARRKLIHEGEHQSPAATFSFVTRFIQELKGTRPKRLLSHAGTTQAAAAGWRPPPAGFAKINVDGAVYKTPPIGAVSAVCRDDHGKYLGASALVFHGLTDPHILETLACREAQALAQDLLLQHIVVASDCLTAVRDINSGTHGITGQIVEEVIDGISNFQHISFVHEGRVSNREAHLLAKHALHLGEGRHMWLPQPSDLHVIPELRVVDQ
ncbi:hypothetical protein D1007_62058 [Hordeum vulgare]|nr:hypothetical protein D1007_62058 [Hordeum vulgare]